MSPTADNVKRSEQLQQLIHATIPLGKAMNVQVVALDADYICIEAPVGESNINIHKTAFAGSIYSVCALTAWGFVHMRLLEEDIVAEVVLAQAEIRYLLPIRETIRASSCISENDYAEFKSRLASKGRSNLSLKVNAKEKDKVQASLQARVAVKIKQA